jgi:fermentation-respiration switch protein FrsA (DUF1100 family)
MMAAKRNLSKRKLGKGRGVPLRLMTAIARRYSLAQIIIWTFDRQHRSRIMFWGSSDGPALVAQGFAEKFAKAIGWPPERCDFEMSFVRKLKDRIKDLELQFARIMEREGDPIEIARKALKLPEDV